MHIQVEQTKELLMIIIINNYVWLHSTSNSQHQTILDAAESNTILHYLIYQNGTDRNTDGAHTKRLLNNSVASWNKYINNYPIIDSMIIVDSTYINLNYCPSPIFMIAIKLISVNMNLKILNDTPIASIENVIVSIIFISITIGFFFTWNQNQLESQKYQLSRWLMTCTLFTGLSHHIIKMTINI